MKILEIQDAIDPITGLEIRIEVLQEAIDQTLKYMSRRPEYSEWYDFSIQHMRTVQAAYQLQIDKLQGVPNGTEVH